MRSSDTPHGKISIGANVHARRLGLLPYVAPMAELPAAPKLEIA